MGWGSTVSTDRERGVERLIDLAERALVAGDEARAFSLASQARVLSPGDVRIQRIFQTEAAARPNRRRLMLWIGVVVIVLAVAAVGFAIAIS